MPGCGLLAFRPAWPRGNAVASGRFRCVAVKATGSQLGAVGFRLLACCGRGAGMIGGADNVAACALYDVDVARDGTCRCLTGTPGTYYDASPVHNHARHPATHRPARSCVCEYGI
jgi:hypothetical protein